MSLSIKDLISGLNTAKNVASKVESVLFNPDLPSSKDFNDLIEIRDKAYSALRLSNQPRNGSNFMLPRTVFDDDPRKDSFLQENSIDPNVIRKKMNPDAALPSLESTESTLFSLEKSNVVADDFVGLIQAAHKNYANYKNRFIMPPANPFQAPLSNPIAGEGSLTSAPIKEIGQLGYPKEYTDYGKDDTNGSKFHVPLDVTTNQAHRSSGFEHKDLPSGTIRARDYSRIKPGQYQEIDPIPPTPPTPRKITTMPVKPNPYSRRIDISDVQNVYGPL
jgi:hypothetical protein